MRVRLKYISFEGKKSLTNMWIVWYLTMNSYYLVRGLRFKLFNKQFFFSERENYRDNS